MILARLPWREGLRLVLIALAWLWLCILFEELFAALDRARARRRHPSRRTVARRDSSRGDRR